MKSSSQFLLRAKFHLLSLHWAGCRHRNTERLRFEGMSRQHLVQPPQLKQGHLELVAQGHFQTVFLISWRETPPPLRPTCSSAQISRSYMHA